MNEFDQQRPNRLLWFLLGGCLAVVVCLVITLCIGLFGYLYYTQEAASQPDTPVTQATRDVIATRIAGNPVPTVVLATPLPTVAGGQDEAPLPTVTTSATTALDVPVGVEQRPIPLRAWQDLGALYETEYPPHNYFETAVRLGKRSLGPRTVVGQTYQVGDTRSFYNGGNLIEATLLAVGEHTYFWVEDGLNLDATAVAAAAEKFETMYYPTVVDLFGEVWTPGVDNDPRFSVLHVREGTSHELGRFDSSNQFPGTLNSSSNEQEMIYINMNSLSLGSDLYFGTLVHETQHLIQWNVDPGETLWVNEGLSQLAEIVVGLETAETADYLLAPETRLNSWNFDEDAVFAHYAASYLFMVYFWEQVGETAVQALSRHPANGMAGIRAVLQAYRPDLTVEQFVGDWAVANYLDDAAAGEQYVYEALDFRRPSYAAKVTSAPFEAVNELDQFGVHYVDLNDLRGETTVSFAGDTVVELIDGAPASGEQMWFAPPVDEMNAQLTAVFDLRQVDRATLRYAVWYDLEQNYDYAYVSASVDGGDSWSLLVPEYATVGEFGPAYNGRSADSQDARNGWLKETVSLNTYTGQIVQVRFDVLTDSDIVGRGFAIDDITIPEAGYFLDVENDLSYWQSDGFVPLGWQIPQQWKVQLIEGGPQPRVTTLPLDALNRGRWTIDVGKGGGLLVITPLTPFVDEAATYWLHVEQ